MLHQVLDTLQPYEREVEDHEGRAYLMRVRPYRTGDDRIDGTVLQLFDVSEIKRSLERVKHARDYAETIVNTIREPLAVLDERSDDPGREPRVLQSDGTARGRGDGEADRGSRDGPVRHAADPRRCSTSSGRARPSCETRRSRRARRARRPGRWW